MSYTKDMAFNHYAKVKRILASEPNGWYIRRINEPTTAQNFRGETVRYDHYYRVYSASDQPIAYCKFQQLDKFADTMRLAAEELPVIND